MVQFSNHNSREVAYTSALVVWLSGSVQATRCTLYATDSGENESQKHNINLPNEKELWLQSLARLQR